MCACVRACVCVCICTFVLLDNNTTMNQVSGWTFDTDLYDFWPHFPFWPLLYIGYPPPPFSKRGEISSSYFFFDVVKKREGPGNILFTVRDGLTTIYRRGFPPNGPDTSSNPNIKQND